MNRVLLSSSLAVYNASHDRISESCAMLRRAVTDLGVSLETLVQSTTEFNNTCQDTANTIKTCARICKRVVG